MTAPIATPATAQAVQVAPPAPTATPPGVTQAAIFAREYAKDAARGMLGALDQIGRNAVRITKIALSVSMPHQVAFLLSLIIPHMHFNTPVKIIESIGMILLVLGAPVIADLLIVNSIKVIGQPAADDSSKKTAIKIMLAPVIASAGVNALAPAPHWVLRILAVFVVVAIPMSEILRFKTRPNFAKIEAMELQVEAQLMKSVSDAIAEQQVTAPAPAPVVPDHRQLNKQRMIAAQKARELAAENPSITPAMLIRATGCGRGAAKKAIEAAKASLETETAEAVAV